MCKEPASLIIKNRLLKVSNELAKVPSLGWALGYFLVIIIFAATYTLNSSGFYHSTSQFEISLNDDAQEIIISLESLFKSASNFSEYKYSGWRLVEDRFSVHSLKTFDDNLGFSIHAAFEKEQDLIGMNIALYFALSPELTTCKNTSCYSTRIVQTARPIIDQENNYFTLTPQALAYYGDINLIQIPIEIDNRINGFVAATKGFPSEASGSFGRMLYFSVVTITTLGYGDIVPITDFNRFLVGLESIAGLVLIGLFLNSLSRERRETF
jgi:hypothetical protein